jgi:gluconate 2-dehydrogenase gamma chain
LLPFFDTYCAGLISLEKESRKQFEQSFSSLSEKQKDAILSQVEAGNVLATWTVSPQAFFTLLTNTTAEGFYSEPEQGGNHERVSWAMIGFDANETNA